MLDFSEEEEPQIRSHKPLRLPFSQKLVFYLSKLLSFSKKH